MAQPLSVIVRKRPYFRVLGGRAGAWRRALRVVGEQGGTGRAAGAGPASVPAVP